MTRYLALSEIVLLSPIAGHRSVTIWSEFDRYWSSLTSWVFGNLMWVDENSKFQVV